MAASSSSLPTQALKIPMAPGALPVIGHALEYNRDPLDFMEFAASWGPVVKVRIGPLVAYVIRDPLDIERIVVGEHKRLTRDKTTLMLRRILGDGLLTTDGDVWLRHRKLISPIFQPAGVAELGAIMIDVAERRISRFECKKRRDLHVDMMQITADIVTHTLFSSDLGSDMEKVGPALECIVDHYGHGFTALIPGYDRLPLPANKRAKAALALLDAILMRLVRSARAQTGCRPDLLSRLLAARDDAGTGLGDSELRDHLMTFFLAGHETTALALTFALVLLAKHPYIEEKLRAEISQVLGDQPLTAQHVSRLPYTRAVVLESLRLYPPAWAIGRETREELSVSGHRIPQGAQLWMLQWVNHRDPRYFPDPLEFRPERWLDGLERSLPRFAYYPFGGGPRICIGNHFAMLEAVLALATFVRKMRVHLVNPDARMQLLASITLRPKHPIPVVYESLEPRTKHP